MSKETIYGYAGVSTREQNEDRQIIALMEMGVPEQNIYLDKLSGKNFCILSIGNPQNCHQNSLFLEREFLVFVRTRFLHSEVLSGASMHAASDNFSRRT